MAEVILESHERQSEVIGNVLRSMTDLHARSTAEKADDERISEGMSSQIIGKTTQRAHQALVDLESRRLQEIATEEQWGAERLAQELSAMKLRITREMFMEHWYESTLSTPEYPIHSATYGTSMFRYDLRMLTAERPSPGRLGEFAWIMFDVNGLRSFKDCTSHEHTTKFLRGIVRIFVDPSGPTRTRLAMLGIRVIPMATGGDEFVLYLRGRSPLPPGIVDDVVSSFQQEISSDEVLQTFLDYDDEDVLVRYGMPSSQQRREFGKLSGHEKRRKLDAIRSDLPDKFTPSIAGGGALLTEGILIAVEKDEYDLREEESFQSLREKVVQSTISRAEELQQKNKKNALQLLERIDPKEYAFRLRNHQNRLLHAEKSRLKDENRRLEDVVAALQQQLHLSRQEIEKILAG